MVVTWWIVAFLCSETCHFKVSQRNSVLTPTYRRNLSAIQCYSIYGSVSSLYVSCAKLYVWNMSFLSACWNLAFLPRLQDGFIAFSCIYQHAYTTFAEIHYYTSAHLTVHLDMYVIMSISLEFDIVHVTLFK